uniref:Uncharacterized protein n=1 Tax=Globisporangium ultimum (strain ATCC 200006 / CBS 805.95 / DAOM BR144) TaxID=431595 RepID=K3WUB3_GLOUD
MLPPLNLAESSKTSFFSRKRVDGGGPHAPSHTPSPRVRRQTAVAPPSLDATFFAPSTPRAQRTAYSDRPRRHDSSIPSRDSLRPTAADDLSMVPREFFVVETNAVLPVSQYPMSQYQSSFTPQSLWETTVFPALSPQTRQQVLYLRQALEKMRAALPETPNFDLGDPCASARVLEYTKEEFRIYSLCFHELIRQIKFICREQSELLREIREHYDAALHRTINQIHHLNGLVGKQQHETQELIAKHEQALRSKDELLDQALLAQSTMDDQPRRNNFVCRRCGEGDFVDDDDSSDCDDDGKLVWRRQRRNCVQLNELQRTRRRQSLEEEHLAAARLQSAYQKYHLRKEQHRLALREEKHSAALDIQRSYRGFKERRQVLHRRAVIQIILKRRKEYAAIELLQANVRAYLLKRKKLDTMKAKRLTQTQAAPSNSSADESDKAMTAKAPVDHRVSDLVVTLRSFLDEMSDITTAISSEIQGHDTALIVSSKADGHISGTERHEALAESNNGLSSPIDETILRQAENLVASFHAAIRSLKSHAQAPASLETSEDLAIESNVATDKDEEIRSDSHANDQQPESRKDAAGGRKESSSSPRSLDLEAQGSENRRESKLQQSIVELANANSNATTLKECNGDFHLDESLWNASLNAISLNTSRAAKLQSAEVQLADRISSRDAKKKLVWLKQLISDTYDTIVGKLRELSPHALTRLINSRCALALSFQEWQQVHRNRNAPILNVSVLDIVREHFHCQSGLKHMVDASMSNLSASLESFGDIDPDVKRFHAFFQQERSHNELLFYYVCRHLASNSDAIDDGPGIGRSTMTQRQPVFHSQTMRELIALPQALNMAKTLFRVDEEASLRDADAAIVEVENAVYKKYQPSSGYNQLEAVLSNYFTNVDSSTPSMHAGNALDCTDTSTSLVSSPVPGSMVRSSNVKQFHAKQFNVMASRSPLVRRHQQKTAYPLGASTTSRDSCSETKWLHFDEFIDLLLKYQSDMNHFHLFAQWTRELYATTIAANAAAVRTTASGDGENGESIQLLDDSAFVDALAPYSLGIMERELQNIFHNALKQRGLQQWMPLRVFVSVVLLMLRNGLLSVSSTFRPQQQREKRGRTRGQGSSREEIEEKRWMRLALRWRTRENVFETALEALYESTSEEHAATAKKLLEWRNELYKLFIQSSGPDNLRRAEELYKLIVTGINEQLALHGGTAEMMTPLLESDEDDYEDRDDGGDDASFEDTERGDRPRQPRGSEAVHLSQWEEPMAGSAWETDSLA